MSVPHRPLRILLATLAGGDSIAVTPIARALRDAGMEVIYSGLHQTAQTVVDAALQEGVDVVCIMGPATATAQGPAQVVELLREAGAAEKLVVQAGSLPDAVAREPSARGVADGSTMEAETGELVSKIEAWWSAR